MTDQVERLRILQAAMDDRLFVASTGRYRIDGEAVPARKARERLVSGGYLKYSYRSTGCRLRPTPAGEREIIRLKAAA